MAGYGDILTSFLQGQDSALKNQIDLFRLEEQQRQNTLAQQNFERQLAFDRQKFNATNAYNQGILRTQQNADRRAEDEAARLETDREDDALINFFTQKIGLTSPFTIEMALDPNNVNYFQSLGRVSTIREMVGGEILSIDQLGEKDGIPQLSVRIRSDKTGTEGPVSSKRGTGADETIMVFTPEGLNKFLNDARRLALAKRNVMGAPAAGALAAMGQGAQDAEASTIKAIAAGSEIKPIEQYAVNADKAASMQGRGPVGTGAPYSGTVAQGNAVAASQPTAQTSTPAAQPAAQPANAAAQPTTALGQIDQDIAALQKVRQMYVQGTAGIAQGPGGMYGGVNISPGSRVAQIDAQIAALEAQKNPAPAQAALGANPSAVQATSAAQPTAAPPAQPAVALGQPASMQNYLFDGMGTQQRITNLVDSLTAPFAQTAKSAADAYNASANFTGTTRSAEDLQLISFLEQSKQITPEAAAQLRATGRFEDASTRDARVRARMSDARAILTDAQGNQRAITTSVMDNERQLVTGAQTQSGQDNRAVINANKELQKKQMEINAERLKGAPEETRKAYTYITSTVAPNVLNQLGIEGDEYRDMLTGVISNVWATLPELQSANGPVSLRSNDPGQQQRIATGVVNAYQELQAYNKGKQFKSDGVIDWIADVVTPDILRDWARTDFKTKEINGLVFTALGVSGLTPEEFANIVLEPMASAKGKVRANDVKKMLGAMIAWDENRFGPMEPDNVKELVRQTMQKGE